MNRRSYCLTVLSVGLLMGCEGIDGSAKELACELESHGYGFSDLELGEYESRAEKLVRTSTITVFGADCEPHQVTVKQKKTVARGEGDEEMTVTDETAGTEMTLNWQSELAMATIQAGNSTVNVTLQPDGTALIASTATTTVTTETGEVVEATNLIVPVEVAESYAWGDNNVPDQFSTSIEAVAQVDAETQDQGGDTAFRPGLTYSPPRPTSFTTWSKKNCKQVTGSSQTISVPGGSASACYAAINCCPSEILNMTFSTTVTYRRNRACPSNKPYEAYGSLN